MAKIARTIDQAAANLSAAAASIPAKYQAGVQNADFVKHAASDQAEANYAAGVQQAVAAKSRAAGVRRAGDEGWRSGALGKGVQRIASGIQAGLDKYRTNFAPVLAAISAAAASAPPRTTDPIANIDNRLKPVVMAAVKAKVRGSGK